MEVILGGISSLLYGVADFLGGQGAKRAPAAAIVLWAGMFSFPILLVAALITGGTFTLSDMVLGGLAGLSGALGLVALFAGLSRGQAAAVAPVAAAVSALLPVLVALAEGERPSVLAWVGVALAVPAIVLCSWVADPGEVPAGGLGYGILAGLGFGGFTVVIRLTSAGSDLLPLIASRGSTILTVAGIAALGWWRVTGLAGIPKGLVLANGILDVSANVTLLLALRAGSLALAAVAASFYPAVTVLMARLVSAEHLRRRQVAGLALTVAALSVISMG